MQLKNKFESIYDLKAQSWCFEQGYKIYIVPLNNKGTLSKVAIELGNKKVLTNEIFKNQSDASKEVWRIYKKLYNVWVEQNKIPLT